MLIYLKYAMSTLFGALTAHKLCKKWDSRLNQLLDEHWDSSVAIGVDDLKTWYNHSPKVLTVQLGDCLVWVANSYYSYGYIYHSNIRGDNRWGNEVPDSLRRRCKVSTMSRLDKLVEDIYKAREEEQESLRAVLEIWN